MVPRKARILLVEDSAADANLTHEAFRVTSVRRPDSAVHLVHVWDGHQALEALRGPVAELPDLVLLDLNMPRKGGHEVLAERELDPKLRCVPFLVLTTSDSPVDIARAYRHGANAYTVKPNDFDAYVDLIARIRAFWLGPCRAPRGCLA